MKWHSGQHYVIINTESGNWVQQSYTPDPRSVDVLNDHEVRCGRYPIYEEKKFTTKEIQDKNNENS